VRRTRTIVQSVALAAAAVLAIAAPAGASPLTTNLLANGDEGSLWSMKGYSVVPLDAWVKDPVNAPVTRVAYGAPGFPTIAHAAAIGGGTTFLAGGPSTDADTSPGFSNPVIHQQVVFAPRCSRTSTTATCSSRSVPVWVVTPTRTTTCRSTATCTSTATTDSQAT
jgi:hypothetical protein